MSDLNYREIEWYVFKPTGREEWHLKLKPQEDDPYWNTEGQTLFVGYDKMLLEYVANSHNALAQASIEITDKDFEVLAELMSFMRDIEDYNSSQIDLKIKRFFSRLQKGGE